MSSSRRTFSVVVVLVVVVVAVAVAVVIDFHAAGRDLDEARFAKSGGCSRVPSLSVSLSRIVTVVEFVEYRTPNNYNAVSVAVSIHRINRNLLDWEFKHNTHRIDCIATIGVATNKVAAANIQPT